MKKLFAYLAIFALALSFAHAQLNITVAPATPGAVAIRTDVSLVNAILANSPSVQNSFVNDGLTYTLVDNPFLGQFVVGTGEFGGFFGDFSYIGKESADPNIFGVSDGSLLGVGNTNLYYHYDASSLLTSYHFSDPTGYSEVNFWHYDENGPFAGTKWMDDPIHFLWFGAIDVPNNLLKYVVRVDDRGSELIDHQDFVGYFQTNLNPVNDLVAVPESATIGYAGVGMLIVAFLYRRNKRSIVNQFAAA